MKKKTDRPVENSAGEGLSREKLSVHIKALRKAVLVSLVAVALCFIVIFFGFSRQLLLLLEAPMRERGIALIYISLYESVFIQMKAAFIAAIVLSSPLILAQIWFFIKPALYPRETKTVILLFFITLILFLSGAAFAWFIVFRLAVAFFLASGEGIASPFISIERYINLLGGFVLPFGMIFELPVAMALLSRSGIVKVETYSKLRKFVFLGIFIIAAILTPPDVFSQVLLALPLILLFEAGIIVSRIVSRRRGEQLR
jgi:sec-independent protein translocase protein TatC